MIENANLRVEAWQAVQTLEREAENESDLDQSELLWAAARWLRLKYDMGLDDLGQ